MSTNRASVQLYSTRIPIDGWGGIPLLAMAAVVAAALPEALDTLLLGVAGGAMMGWLLIRHRAH